MSDRGVAAIDPPAAGPAPATPPMPAAPAASATAAASAAPPAPTASAAGPAATWLPPTVQQPGVTPPTFGVPTIEQPAVTPPTMAVPTVEQPVVAFGPGVAGPAGGANRRRVAWIAGGAFAAVVATGVGVAALTGGDDSSQPGTTITTVVGPATTSAPLTLPTMAPSTSAPPASDVATTAPATTGAQTALPYGDDLVFALPGATDLPADWVPYGNEPEVDYFGGEGNGQGLCGGEGESARAWSGESIGNAFGDSFELPSTATVSYWLVGFPDEASAAAYLAATEAQAESCAAGITYDLVEGDDAGQYDGFAEGYGDGEVVWTFEESADGEPTTVDGADEALDLVSIQRYTTNAEGVEYGGFDGSLRTYERYGSVIFVGDLFGTWGLEGFDPEGAADYLPTPEDLALVMEAARPGVLDRLRIKNLID